jgi:hypothetical protein
MRFWFPQASNHTREGNLQIVFFEGERRLNERVKARLHFFIFILMRVCAGRGGYPRVKKVIPANRPDPTGFEKLQPEPAKTCTKTARIGAVRGGPDRVGRIGRVLPTPNQNELKAP